MSDRLHVHVPCAQLDQLLPLLIEQRLQPEIAFKWFDLDRAPAEVSQWGRRLADAGLAVSVHAPFMDLNPGAIDPLIRDVTRRRFDRTLQLAGLLNARLIVFHPGFFRWHYGGRDELWIEASLRFWPDFIAQAATRNCRLMLENIFEEQPDTLQSLLDEIDSPWLGHCFDFGHWHLFGQGTLDQWFAALGRHTRHLHLHDNHGERDAHLAVGEGSADFTGLFKILDSLDLRPSATLEIHNKEALLQTLPDIAPRFRD